MWRKFIVFSLFLNLLLAGLGLWAVDRLGGFAYLRFKMQHQGISGVYAHRVDQFRHHPTPEGAVVFVGNSLTAQGAWGEWYPRWPIYNRGIEGDQTQWLADRLDPILEHPPAVLVLMIGINDLIAAAPETVLDRHAELLDAIARRSPETQVLVQSLLPVNSDLRHIGIKNGSIRTLNQGLTALARERSRQHSVCYVDLHRHFCDEAGQLNPRFSVDGIHLNGAGYALWRSILEPFLEHAVQKSKIKSSSQGSAS